MACSGLVVLRLSGGIMKGEHGTFDEDRLDRIVMELASVAGHTKLVVVVGGGNIIRGRLGERFGLPQAPADNIGIMATILNAYMIGALLTRNFVPNVVVSPHNVGTLIPAFACPTVEYLSNCFNRVGLIIVGGGTGKGGVTTDTAAVRLARELRAGIILKGTDVNGIYSADPKSDFHAELLSELTRREFKERRLSQIFDPIALEEMTVPLRVFNILESGLLLKAISGRNIGSCLAPVG